MLRYSVTHPKTCTVNFDNMQKVGEFLFNFKNSTDFSEYRIIDNRDSVEYCVKCLNDLNGIQFEWVK